MAHQQWAKDGTSARHHSAFFWESRDIIPTKIHAPLTLPVPSEDSRVIADMAGCIVTLIYGAILVENYR